MKKHYFWLTIVLMLSVACGSDDPTAGEVGNLTLRDVANTGDASDFQISFRPVEDEARVSEYRIFLVASDQVATFDEAQASALASTSYVALQPQGDILSQQLAAGFLDHNGNSIELMADYQAFVLAVADGDNAVENTLSGPSSATALAVTDLVTTLVAEIPIGSGGMEVDSEGNIYAADFGPSLNGGRGTVVYKITPEGNASVFADGLNGASGNALDSEGNLFQSNIAGNEISKIAPDGTVTRFSTQGLGGPVGIAIDAEDTLYVANCGGGGAASHIRKITKEGTSTQHASSTLFNCANGIAIDEASGNLYVANFGNGNILEVTPNGEVSIFVNVPGGGNGHITMVDGVLYVVARVANQIYRLTLDGELTLLAGSGARGIVDGAALEAAFSLPNDLAASPDGKILYINDVVSTIGTNIISPVAIRALSLEAGN